MCHSLISHTREADFAVCLARPKHPEGWSLSPGCIGHAKWTAIGPAYVCIKCGESMLRYAHEEINDKVPCMVKLAIPALQPLWVLLPSKHAHIRHVLHCLLLTSVSIDY